uniref:Uncharacterized protein n=1 Tax=Arundo donax TaxID=35708 RepID=A0A0A8Y4G8_ARUDO
MWQSWDYEPMESGYSSKKSVLSNFQSFA